MTKKVNYKRVISQVIVWTVVIILTLSCLLPLINMLAISLSGSDAVAANEVGFIPKDFTLVTYKKIVGGRAVLEIVPDLCGESDLGLDHQYVLYGEYGISALQK